MGFPTYPVFTAQTIDTTIFFIEVMAVVRLPLRWDSPRSRLDSDTPKRQQAHDLCNPYPIPFYA